MKKNREVGPPPVLPGQTTIFSRLTEDATEKREVVVGIDPAKPGADRTVINGKICGVCKGAYVHEDKCTNQQLPLEGSKVQQPLVERRS